MVDEAKVQEHLDYLQRATQPGGNPRDIVDYLHYDVSLPPPGQWEECVNAVSRLGDDVASWGKTRRFLSALFESDRDDLKKNFILKFREHKGKPAVFGKIGNQPADPNIPGDKGDGELIRKIVECTDNDYFLIANLATIITYIPSLVIGESPATEEERLLNNNKRVWEYAFSPNAANYLEMLGVARPKDEVLEDAMRTTRVVADFGSDEDEVLEAKAKSIVQAMSYAFSLGAYDIMRTREQRHLPLGDKIAIVYPPDSGRIPAEGLKCAYEGLLGAEVQLIMAVGEPPTIPPDMDPNDYSAIVVTDHSASLARQPRSIITSIQTGCAERTGKFYAGNLRLIVPFIETEPAFLVPADILLEDIKNDTGMRNLNIIASGTPWAVVGSEVADELFECARAYRADGSLGRLLGARMLELAKELEASGKRAI